MPFANKHSLHIWFLECILKNIKFLGEDPPKVILKLVHNQLKKRAKKIVDTFNEATKDNDVLKNIAISTLYTANFEFINKMIKLRSQDDPLSEQDIVDIIVNAGLSERQLGTTKQFGLVKDKYHGYT